MLIAAAAKGQQYNPNDVVLYYVNYGDSYHMHVEFDIGWTRYFSEIGWVRAWTPNGNPWRFDYRMEPIQIPLRAATEDAKKDVTGGFRGTFTAIFDSVSDSPPTKVQMTIFDDGQETIGYKIGYAPGFIPLASGTVTTFYDGSGTAHLVFDITRGVGQPPPLPKKHGPR